MYITELYSRIDSAPLRLPPRNISGDHVSGTDRRHMIRLTSSFFAEHLLVPTLTPASPSYSLLVPLQAVSCYRIRCHQTYTLDQRAKGSQTSRSRPNTPHPLFWPVILAILPILIDCHIVRLSSYIARQLVSLTRLSSSPRSLHSLFFHGLTHLQPSNLFMLSSKIRNRPKSHIHTTNLIHF